MDPKLFAILNILGDLTGLPLDLIEEFFIADIDQLIRALRDLGEARRQHGPNSPQYRQAKQRVERILQRIYRRLFSRQFRQFLIRRLGREAAERLLERMAALVVPILGWAYFGILFIGLLYCWWEVILDP